MTEQDSDPKSILNPLQARVLGSLMEKEQTTPDAYPLTLNSLVTACNQKTSREPVMDLSSVDVKRCLNELRERGFVEVEYGSRADRFAQKFTRKMFLDAAEQALFGLLMLRGPQTANELFSRSKRMHDFGSIDKVRELTEHLLSKTEPMLVLLPAQAGQREDRYMHLFCGAVEAGPAPAPRTTRPVMDAPTSADHTDSLASLVERVERLEAQVAKLMADKIEDD